MRSPIENVALRLHQQEADPHPQYLKRKDYKDPAKVPAQPTDPALLARIAADEAAAAGLAQRVHVLEDEIPTQDQFDARYLRTDAWIINIDPGTDFGEILVNVDTLAPVYNTESPVAIAVPIVIAPLAAVGLDNTVNCLLLVGTKLYVGGSFTAATDASGTVTRNHAACLELTTGLWTQWDPDVSSGGATTVDGICVTPDGSAIFVVGSFTTVGGSSRTNIAQVDPATGAVQPWIAGSTLNARALGATASSTLVYVSGVFTAAGGSTRNYFAAFDVSTGTLSSWDAGANSPAFGTNPYGLAPIIDGGGIVLAGGFVSLHGTDRFYSGRVDAVTGALDTGWVGPLSFDASGNTEASILTHWFDLFLIGKSFGFPGSNVVDKAYEATGGAVGGFSMSVTAGGIVDTESISGATYDPDAGPLAPIYVGGSYSTIKGVSRANLCAVNPTTGTPISSFTPAPNGAVNAVAFLGGMVIAVGAFTTVGSKTRNRLAVINPVTGIAA